MPERSTESDSDFEQVALRTRNVPISARAVDADAAVDLVDAQEMRADRHAAPQHQAVAPLAFYRFVAEIPKALAVPAFISKAAVTATAALNFVVAGDAKATSGTAAAPSSQTDHEEVLLVRTMDKRLDVTARVRRQA